MSGEFISEKEIRNLRRIMDGWEWGALTHWVAMSMIRERIGGERDKTIKPNEWRLELE